MGWIMNGVSKEEVIFAAKMGRGHESAVSFKHVMTDIRDVAAETVVRSVRKAASFQVSLREASTDPAEGLIWNVITHVRPNPEFCPIYEFVAPTLDEVRALMLAKKEKKELSSVAKKGKQARRKGIDD